MTKDRLHEPTVMIEMQRIHNAPLTDSLLKGYKCFKCNNMTITDKLVCYCNGVHCYSSLEVMKEEEKTYSDNEGIW